MQEALAEEVQLRVERVRISTRTSNSTRGQEQRERVMEKVHEATYASHDRYLRFARPLLTLARPLLTPHMQNVLRCARLACRCNVTSVTYVTPGALDWPADAADARATAAAPNGGGGAHRDPTGTDGRPDPPTRPPARAHLAEREARRQSDPPAQSPCPLRVCETVQVATRVTPSPVALRPPCTGGDQRFRECVQAANAEPPGSALLREKKRGERDEGGEPTARSR